MGVLYNVDDHHAHGQLRSDSKPITSSLGEQYIFTPEPQPLVDDSTCLGSHRCRIYQIASLLTDSRWLGASTLYLELISSDRTNATTFQAALQEALLPHIHARISITSPHSIKVEDLSIEETQIDPSKMLPLASQILYVEVEKPRNWRADRAKLSHSLSDTTSSSTSSSDSSPPMPRAHGRKSSQDILEAVTAAAASALPTLSSLLVTPPSSALGASLNCRLFRSNGSTASTQQFLDKLSHAIAHEAQQSHLLLRTLYRSLGTEDEILDLDAELRSFLSDANNTAPSSSTSLSTTTGSPAKKLKQSQHGLTARVRTQLLKHDVQRQKLVSILHDVQQIQLMHTCNVCERILRIESDSTAPNHDSDAVSPAASAKSSIASKSPTTPPTPLLSPVEVLARYDQLIGQIKSAVGNENKLKRKKLNTKLRELKEKYANMVQFPDAA